MTLATLPLVHEWVPREAAKPVLLLLHGTGGDERDLLPLGADLLPGASLLSPRGAVLERGMPRFFRRLAEGVFDQADLAARTEELATFVRGAAEAYRFDPARVVAVGFSNGANIAASLLLKGTGVLAGGVLLRPMVPFEPASPPDLRGRQVLLAAGRHDPIVPLEQPERLRRLLAGAGAEATLEWRETGHGLVREDVDRARAWLAARFA